jgi:hypothetical protein
VLVADIGFVYSSVLVVRDGCGDARAPRRHL